MTISRKAVYALRAIVILAGAPPDRPLQIQEMAETGGDPKSIARDRGFEAMDQSDLESLVDQVIASNPDEWERFTSGDEADQKKMAGFLTGQIMKATRGQADGKAVAGLLDEKAQPA